MPSPTQRKTFSPPDFEGSTGKMRALLTCFFGEPAGLLRTEDWMVDRLEIEPVTVCLFAIPSSPFASVIGPIGYLVLGHPKAGYRSDRGQSQLSFATYSVCDRSGIRLARSWKSYW
jgi:hypothetical protein